MLFRSEQGKGMTTIMRIPLTMAIMDGMEVSVGDSIFTIPINNIRSSIKTTEAAILHDSVNGEMVKMLDGYYPVIRARDFYIITVLTCILVEFPHVRRHRRTARYRLRQDRSRTGFR